LTRAANLFSDIFQQPIRTFGQILAMGMKTRNSRFFHTDFWEKMRE